MGLIDRMIAFRQAWVAAKEYKFTLKDPTMLQVLGMTQADQLSDPYSQIATVYACVSVKARTIAGIPFKLYPLKRKGAKMAPGAGLVERTMVLKQMADSGDEVTSGPVYNLFADPNPTMSRYQLWEAIVTNLDLTGEWMVVKDRELIAGGIPSNLWPWWPKQFKPAMVNGAWVGWTLARNKAEEYLKREDVIFDKYLSPRNEIRGLSPLDSLKLTVSSHFNAMLFNSKFFENDATPSTVYTTEKSLSDVQFARLKAELVDSERGVTKAHKARLLENGITVERIGLSQKDMDFLGLIKASKEEICSVYGVPKSVISMYEDTNYATAGTADRAFITKTCLPIMMRIEDKFNQELLGALGYEGRFDLNAVDAINYDFLNRVAAATQLYTLGFTANEINRRLNLGFGEESWRDDPAGLGAVPPDPTTAPKGAEVAPPPAKAQLQDAVIVEAIRAKKWTELTRKVEPIAARMNREMKAYFLDIEKKLLKRLVKALPGAITRTAEVLLPIDDLFDDSKLRSVCRGPIEDGVRTGVATVGVSFDLVSESALATMSQRIGRVVGINETGREQLKAALKKIIEDGIAAGKTEAEIAKDIYDAAKDQMRNMETRARTIARTEVHGAFSEGRMDAMESTKPMAKRWISSRDDRVRDSHRHLDGKTIPWDAHFGNGLAFPMDPSGDAGEIINCRCVLVPVYDEKGMEEAEASPMADPPRAAEVNLHIDVTQSRGTVRKLVSMTHDLEGNLATAEIIEAPDGE